MLILGPKSIQLSTLTIRVQLIVTTRDQHKCDLTEHKLGFVDNNPLDKINGNKMHFTSYYPVRG